MSFETVPNQRRITVRKYDPKNAYIKFSKSAVIQSLHALNLRHRIVSDFLAIITFEHKGGFIMNEPGPLTYNLSEAAEALHVSRPTMLSLVHTDGFPAFRIGRRWIIPADNLKQWLHEQATSTMTIKRGA